ncbi:MAG: nucleotidyltransferase family protein [Lachnospiraceae bacterium]|nr:nucleotidyltransferase family protein [Lachnospiraceae bacterium]
MIVNDWKTADAEKQNRSEYDLLYLINCVINDVVPQQQRMEQMDLRAIYKAARFHTLAAITCMALESADAFRGCTDTELVRKWKECKEKAIRKTLLLDAERQNICSFMEQEHIWYMPLKGVVLKEFYPKLGMRQMADNDILFDSTFQNEVCQWMVHHGYKAVSVGKGNHDVYEKKPVYNFEMHTSLYGKGHDKNWVSYYQDVKERLIQDKENKYEYHFTDEDFYIYIITHAYKHYNGSGTGIRSLLDIAVYLRKKGASLDWEYIFGELKKLHVAEFEENSRNLAEKVFSMDQYYLTEDETGLLDYFLGAGTYGTMQNRVEKKIREYQPEGNLIKGVTKRRYILERLFPDESFYQDYVPFAYRHRWFRPFYLVYRVIRGVVRNGKMIVRELRMVIKTDK